MVILDRLSIIIFINAPINAPINDTISPIKEIPNPTPFALPDDVIIRAIPNNIIAIPNIIIFNIIPPFHYLVHNSLNYHLFLKFLLSPHLIHLIYLDIFLLLTQNYFHLKIPFT